MVPKLKCWSSSIVVVVVVFVVVVVIVVVDPNFVLDLLLLEETGAVLSFED